jgi:hypothetical protein
VYCCGSRARRARTRCGRDRSAGGCGDVNQWRCDGSIRSNIFGLSSQLQIVRFELEQRLLQQQAANPPKLQLAQAQGLPNEISDVTFYF